MIAKIARLFGGLVLAMLAFGALVIVAAIAAVFYLSHALETEVRALRASIKPGAAITTFRAPEGLQFVFIDFKPNAETAPACMSLMLHDRRLMNFGERRWVKPLAAPDDLARGIESLRAEIERCEVMEWTLQGLTPYRGSVRVHYRNGIVERVEEPRFWD
jgi:hypothetical protein